MNWLRKLLKRFGWGPQLPVYIVVSQSEQQLDLGGLGVVPLITIHSERYEECTSHQQALAMHRSDHPDRRITGIVVAR